MLGFKVEGRGKKWIVVSLCFSVILFGLYGLITVTRPNFLFEKGYPKHGSFMLSSDLSLMVVETGFSVLASQEFADGKGHKSMDTYSGLCYIGIDVNGKTEYRWGHVLTISNFSAPKGCWLVTLK
jgi:hypothetical protein